MSNMPSCYSYCKNQKTYMAEHFGFVTGSFLNGNDIFRTLKWESVRNDAEFKMARSSKSSRPLLLTENCHADCQF